MPEINEETSNSDVTVGRIANLKPFPAGVSGNPLGRPIGARSRSTIVKELLSVNLDAKGLDGKDGKYSVEYLVNAALLKKAMEGDVPAIKELQDTLYGKLTDKQELTGKDGDSLKIDVAHLPPDEAYKKIL